MAEMVERTQIVKLKDPNLPYIISRTSFYPSLEALKSDIRERRFKSEIGKIAGGAGFLIGAAALGLTQTLEPNIPNLAPEILGFVKPLLIAAELSAAGLGWLTYLRGERDLKIIISDEQALENLE